MKSLVRVLLYDVLVAMVHIGVDGFLIYSYLNEGNTWWGVTTITAVCLPGVLGEKSRKTRTHGLP